MSGHRLKLGKPGETLAADFLTKKVSDSGSQLLLLFRGNRHRKRHKLAKMALYYLVQKQISWQDYRFDIVPIEYTEGRDQPKANLIRNAFSVKGCYLNELLCNDCMLSIEIPYL